MGRASKEKGDRGERMFAKLLNELGFESARRGAQHKGGPDSPDVVCVQLSGIHFEVKHGNHVRLGTKALADALEQSQREAGQCYTAPRLPRCGRTPKFCKRIVLIDGPGRAQ